MKLSSQIQCTVVRCTAFFFGCTVNFKDSVVQLFTNIYMRTALEKTVHFTNTIVNEIKSQGQCTKMYSVFLWLYSFLMVVHCE